jgi:hypothetical protein
MKRSEMINVLDKAINSQLYLDYLFDEDMLNSVLIAIEQAGMLPPPSSFNIHNVDKQLGFVAEVTYDFSINKDNSVNLWEPEDET